jgi:hypothetical protein
MYDPAVTVRLNGTVKGIQWTNVNLRDQPKTEAAR